MSSTAPLIVMKREHAQIIVDASLGSLPNEACGLILGSVDDDARHVQDIIVTRNTAPHPETRFEMAAEDLLRIHKEARIKNQHVLGHFHSHPNGHNEPSAHDALSAHEVGQIWLIQAVLEDRALGLQAYLAVRDEHWGWPFISLDIRIE